MPVTLLNIFDISCYTLPWWQYVLDFCIITLVWLLRHTFSRMFTLLIYKIINPVIKKISKTDFKNTLAKPIALFLALFVTCITLDKLPFPPCWNFNFFANISFFKVIDCVIITAFVLSIVWIIAQLTNFIALILYQKALHTPNQADNQLIVFFNDFFKILIWIVGVLFVIKFAFKQHIGQLLTGLSLIGAAVALATKESLENLIASFVIFFDKPFAVNDLVKVQNVTGNIEHIGLRSTRIRTLDKTYVTVPNKQMVDSIVDNLSNRTQRRFTTDIDIDTNTPNHLIDTMLAAVQNLQLNTELNLQKINAHITNFTKAGITVNIEIQTETIDIEKFILLKENVLKNIHLQLQNLGIALQKV